ncbi:hypothetical protein [Rhodococcus sp. NPDC057529]|uniref:hypothetical protein n=1 Tax=Rhodococcus sp. NPDC057529 TaxID=3346158 RepID=UPI00366CDD7B
MEAELIEGQLRQHRVRDAQYILRLRFRVLRDLHERQPVPDADDAAVLVSTDLRRIAKLEVADRAAERIFAGALRAPFDRRAVPPAARHRVDGVDGVNGEGAKARRRRRRASETPSGRGCSATVRPSSG